MTSLSSFPNVKAYFNEHQNLAITLTNLGTTITDSRLALLVLYGLSSDYRPFKSTVQHMNPLLSFDSLHSMLELEEHTNNKDKIPSQDSALVSTHHSQNFEKSENLDSRGTTHHRGGRRNNHGYPNH